MQQRGHFECKPDSPAQYPLKEPHGGLEIWLGNTLAPKPHIHEPPQPGLHPIRWSRIMGEGDRRNHHAPLLSFVEFR